MMVTSNAYSLASLRLYDAAKIMLAHNLISTCRLWVADFFSFKCILCLSRFLPQLEFALLFFHLRQIFNMLSSRQTPYNLRLS